jgi:hypothetical protein
MNALLKSPNGLDEIVADVEDIMAERMERALGDGYTPWMKYVIQNSHRDGPRPDTEVDVRIRFEGQAKAELELRYFKDNFSTVIYPDANQWFYPGLEDEAEARAVREPNDKPLKPY